jgi:FKBP-type peptidyl-prolyl cis-trans isomerase
MPKHFRTAAQKTSYALGLDFGTTLKRLPVDLDFACFVEALTDIIKERPVKMEREEWTRLMTEMHEKLQRQNREGREAQANSNVEAGDSFRQEHAAKDGVTVTDSGLQYEVIEAGGGETPAATDTVTVHYKGTLIDGTEFDSSHKRGEPATFPLNRVIKGWTEGVQLMQVGATYRFVLPPELGYGEAGAPPNIGPNATLVFEVQLLGIQ